MQSLELMIAGAGITFVPVFLVADDVAAGSAVRQDAPGSLSAFIDLAITL